MKYLTNTSQYIKHIPFLLWGVLLLLFGALIFLIGLPAVLSFRISGSTAYSPGYIEWYIWLSGAPIIAGILFSVLDLFFLLKFKRRQCGIRWQKQEHPRITVALTAYNDEASIEDAVKDFIVHPLVERVIVVSNNSSDNTMQQAENAGAIVINEVLPGYGRCVFRCLSEAALYDDTDLIVLCEGDRTFRAGDIDKMMSYIPHADVVNGTRIVEQLREYETQLSTFMYYGNFFVGKLLEAKHLGKGTFTDVGTTYKMCRKSALKCLLPHLNPKVNLEFNAHFLDMALTNKILIVECPITFYQRVGYSKGGNVNDKRALQVGIRMIIGLLFGWKRSGT